MAIRGSNNGDDEDEMRGKKWCSWIVVFAAVGALNGCGGQEPSTTPTSYSQSIRTSASETVLPPMEAEFINIVSTAQRGSSQAENDMQRGGVKATRDQAICRILTYSSVENWVGTVTKVDANSDGKGVLYVSVAENINLNTSNNDFSYSGANTLIQPGTELFRAASSLKVGQKVSFSGSFIPRAEGCIEESSITLRGKLDDPDFIFRFSSVGPYDASTSPATSGVDGQSQKCLSYDQPVTITGTMRPQTFPGPPNYESVEKGDAAENVWILDLDMPICTVQTDQDQPSESNIKAMQLTFAKADMYNGYRSLLSKPVTVTGNLWHAITGHHHTSVMLQVASIEP